MPRRTLIALLLLVLFGAGIFVWAADWLTLEWLRSNRDDLKTFCQQNMLMMVLAYCATFVLFAALCVPGVGLITLAGGMLFGQWLGVALATFSALVGATLAFLIARHLLHDWAHARFARAFALIDRGIERDGPFFLFMLRLIVFVPFFVVNPVMGLTDMRLRVFIVASTLGMLANTFVWVNAGTMLGQINHLHDVFSGRAILALALIGILPLALKWLFFREK